jgi:SAM-dependent methyltransferase
MVDTLDCPACGSHGLEPFYRQEDVPVHSCLLLEERDEALQFPTGSIDLAFCTRCGFITNTAFRPGVHRYSEDYEETQEFSPRFQEFAQELAAHWIDRYGLRQSRVLEIGCGKGSFLELFCALGDNEGVGVDPSYRPDRIPEGERLHFVQDFYDERWGPIAADAVICRHTLEHIAPVRKFLRTLREGIADSVDTVVLFELPDTKRVLEEAAFWDVYYEHCSYFTSESLVHTFRTSGFQVLDVSSAFDDQYLLVEAVPGPWQPNRHVPVGDLSGLRSSVEEFAPAVDRRRDEWSQRVADAATSGQRVAVWGSGSKGVAYLTTLGLGDQVEYIVDVNPFKQGRFMAGTGHPIVGPQDLPDCPPDVVIVMNSIYQDEIACTLHDLGVHPEIVTT